ncbi:MAG: NACHT domain-containing NTPase [Cyanothece sp. SIO1E1]|nr:NACHT domain-containing NTPase [Cyanothece sp. SIO1E1]
MAKRSLQASPEGIQKLRKAFGRKGWTQEYLSAEVNLKTRQPIWRCFNGKPIERHTFIEICAVLGLNWWEVADNPPEVAFEIGEHTKSEDMGAGRSVDVDNLVRQIRSLRRDRIQEQCGSLQILNVSHPINIADLYIDVNLQEEISNQMWLSASELQKHYLDEVSCFDSSSASQKQIPIAEAIKSHAKLRILGRLGAGKTTLLQYISIGCNSGEIFTNLIPIFINLGNFAEDANDLGTFSLLNYIRQEFLCSNIQDLEIAETILCEGRALLLLDGLDEVAERDRNRVFKEICKFSEKYYKNLFILTCRTADQEFKFPRFRDFEIVDFGIHQIQQFAHKWFKTFIKLESQDKRLQAEQLIQQLDLLENRQIREFASTPLLLNQICLIFQQMGSFPVDRAEFYRELLDIILRKWDKARGIQRDSVYPAFSLPMQIKLLSQIAAKAFEQGNYFFERKWLEEQIADFICELPEFSDDLEMVRLDSEIILREIELQHGLLVERSQRIYSFSHSGLQKYLVARNIIGSSDLEQALKRLVTSVEEPQWHEIFLLTASMLRDTNSLVLLLKQKVDQIKAELKERYNLNQASLQQKQALEGCCNAMMLLHKCLECQYITTDSMRQEIKEVLVSIPFEDDSDVSNNTYPFRGFLPVVA